jgi:hypothetical protein
MKTSTERMIAKKGWTDRLDAIQQSRMAQCRVCRYVEVSPGKLWPNLKLMIKSGWWF